MTLLRQSLACVLAAATFAAAGAATAAPEPTDARLIPGVYVAGDQVSLIKTQWMWRGRNYCWYNNGWRGPGYYWCGYAFRRGFGWGGPAGWHGWAYDRGYGHDRGWRNGWRNRDRNGDWRNGDRRDRNAPPPGNGDYPR